ncbi:MAG: type 2 isopentenyl-diphosphate Delta-isomerase [Ignavibacteriales bacterium]
MADTPENTPNRKKEHIELCLTDRVAFKEKRNGFDQYEFEHNAITEVEIDKINFRTQFFGHEINFPFIISCMTGGTSEAENINARLATVANELNIPLGVGSQRQALENQEYHSSYRIIRQNAPDIPILGNIGAAEIAHLKSVSEIQYLIDMISAQAFVIHVNPLQELIQKNGEPNFKGLLRNIEKVANSVSVPLIVKEVGAGIGKEAARKLLEAGVQAIDVAGAGGTSWSGVEILRNRGNENDYFWDWGLPTSYCLRTVRDLKEEYSFILIGSGGISNGVEIAKAMALGADLTASARIILQKLEAGGMEGVKNLITDWFDTVKRIMYLTGCQTVDELKKIKLVNKGELY